MLSHGWPAHLRPQAPDLRELRAAIATRDPGRLQEAVEGRAIDDVLQQVGTGATMALDLGAEQVEPLALSVINRLQMRREEGDGVLAEDLLARLRHQPLAGRTVRVDLDMLAEELASDPTWSSGGYIDLDTGEVIGEGSTDAALVGEDAAVDVDSDPDRWLWFSVVGSRDGWQDMADYAGRQQDADLRARLERSIEGKGAFRRFRDIVQDEGLAEDWTSFSSDRRLGRARDLLAGMGIRVGGDRVG